MTNFRIHFTLNGENETEAVSAKTPDLARQKLLDNHKKTNNKIFIKKIKVIK